MATFSYSLFGSYDAQCALGNAVLAIKNVSTTKKVVISHLGIGSYEKFDPTVPTDTIPLDIVAGTAAPSPAGEVTPVPLDTAVSWPAGVRVYSDAIVTASEQVGRIIVGKINPAALVPVFNGLVRAATPVFCTSNHLDASVEHFLVSEGRTLNIVRSNAIGSREIPLEVQATILVDGECFVCHYVTTTCEYRSVFSLINETGSGVDVHVVELEITYRGDTNSPYFEVVPVGSIFAEDATRQVVPVKMDTADPDPATYVACYADAAILPYGLPENALSDASVSGTPKGSNYLKSKDFVGPLYRVMFYELARVNVNFRHDGITMFDNSLDMGAVSPDGCVSLRPGEAIAIVAATETAASNNVTAPSGKGLYQFSVDFDVVSLFTPVLRLTGLKNPTEVRVFDAGTTTELGGSENVTSGVFEFSYDPDEVSSVDIAVLSLGYQNLRYLAVPLGTSDTAIPVQQQLDRQYNNP